MKTVIKLNEDDARMLIGEALSARNPGKTYSVVLWYIPAENDPRGGSGPSVSFEATEDEPHVTEDKLYAKKQSPKADQ